MLLTHEDKRTITMSIPEEHTAIIPFPNGDVILSAQDELRRWRQEAAHRQAYDPTFHMSAQQIAIFQRTQEAMKKTAHEAAIEIRGLDTLRTSYQAMAHSFTILQSAQDSAQTAVRDLAQTMAQTQQAIEQIAIFPRMQQAYEQIAIVQIAELRKIAQDAQRIGAGPSLLSLFCPTTSDDARFLSTLPRSPTVPGDICRPESVATDTEIVIAHTDWDTLTAMCAAEGYTFEGSQPGMARFYRGMVNITLYKAQSHTIVRVNAPEITHEKLHTALCHYVLRMFAERWADYRHTYCDLGAIASAAHPRQAQLADESGTVPPQIAVVSRPMKTNDQKIAELYGEGRTDAEIAEKTGIPLKTVNNKIPILRKKYPELFPRRKS